MDNYLCDRDDVGKRAPSKAAYVTFYTVIWWFWSLEPRGWSGALIGRRRYRQRQKIGDRIPRRIAAFPQCQSTSLSPVGQV